jgi:peptide-methionine (S)-S-oxide reductase
MSQNSLSNPGIEGQGSVEIAIFGSGCFWCTEAIFESIDGVIDVESGYSGGKIKNPIYKEVCSGNTGHAEVVKISFNPKKVSFEFLLSVFFKTHDPTTLNYQGNDHGTQYRSVIFYTTEDQKVAAKSIIEKLNSEKVYDRPIVTELSPFDVFYKAEDYHQDYFAKNPTQGYCQFVVQPKVEKFQKVFKYYLK